MSTQTESEIAKDVEQLIQAARSGSTQALGQLLDSWRDYLLLLANHELKSALLPKAGASDLVQETFLEAHQGIGGFAGRTEGEWVGWLRSILQNNVANFARRYEQTEKREISREIPLEASAHWLHLMEMDLAADTDTPSARAIAHEELVAVERAIERLPEAYRRIIELRHQRGYSFSEMGRRLDRSAEAARKLWSRAIQRLADELNRCE